MLVRKGKIVADGTAAEIKALSAGRTVRATLEAADTDALAKVDGVDSVDVRGDSVLVHGSDSDAIARYLLNHTTARDLEITSRNLEEAFVALTGDDADVLPKEHSHDHHGYDTVRSRRSVASHRRSCAWSSDACCATAGR